MDLYDEADKHLTRFTQVLEELAEANHFMDENQLVDFIDDWSGAVYEEARDQWQIALGCRFSEEPRYQEAWETALDFHNATDGTDALMANCARWFIHFVLVDQFGGYEISPG